MEESGKYLFYITLLKTISPLISFVIGWLLKSPLKKKNEVTVTPPEDVKK